MTLSIVIVNWNTRQLLKQCLESILRFSKDVDCEVIVIDNNSKDQSQELVRSFTQSFHSLRFIQNQQNFGFAKAVNQGIKLSIGDYVLLLNPDTQIKNRTLSKSIDFMRKNQDCGILGAKILNKDGSIQSSVRKFPCLWSQFFILLKIHQFIKLKVIKNYFLTNFDYNQEQEVDQVMGAFFLIHRKVFEKIGYFDEKFFLWFEEVDFCYQAKKANWKIIYYPQVEVVHLGAASFSQKTSVKNQWQFNKSLLYYFRKHHSFFSYFILLIILPFSLFLSLLTVFFPFLRKFKKL